MKYPVKLRFAIAFARLVHFRQIRKGNGQPYIEHPLRVLEIVTTVTEDPNVLCAAVLHDTVEDCRPYGLITVPMVRLLFGANTGSIVGDVTEPDKSLSWGLRKQQAIAHIKQMDKSSLLVKAADLLDNLRSLQADLAERGNALWKKFNRPKQQMLDNYQQVIEAIESTWPEHPLLSDLVKSLALLAKTA